MTKQSIVVMISIEEKYKDIVKEALGEYLYKISLELNEMKGKAMTNRRKELTKKQRLLEEVRSNFS